VYLVIHANGHAFSGLTRISSKSGYRISDTANRKPLKLHLSPRGKIFEEFEGGRNSRITLHIVMRYRAACLVKSYSELCIRLLPLGHSPSRVPPWRRWVIKFRFMP